MSRSEPDATRIVRLWLEEGVTALPDRILDDVLDRIPAMPQRRSSWLAWRSPTMNKFVTIGLAAAAVVVAAFLGYQFLIAPNVGNPPPPSPTPASTPSTAPSMATDSPTSFDNHSGTLLPGSYVLTGVEPFQITFTVPGGWEKLAVPAMLWTTTDDKSTVLFGTVDDLVSDPCDPSQGYAGVGPTAAELITAFDAVPGYSLTSSTETTISGFPATMLDIEWSDPACAEGVEAQLWVTQPGDVIQPHPGGGDALFNRYYILDVDGDRLLIVTLAHVNATDQQVEGIQSILDSTQID